MGGMLGVSRRPRCPSRRYAWAAFTRFTPLVCLALVTAAPVPAIAAGKHEASAPGALLAEVQLDTSSGLPFVPVSINGSKPLSFLLDTGFEASALDSAAAARIGLRPSDMRKENVPGGTIRAGRFHGVRLKMGDLELPNEELSALPLGSLAPLVGRRVDGIIGHSILSRYVVDIDFPAGRVRLLRPSEWTHTGPGLVLPVTF